VHVLFSGVQFYTSVASSVIAACLVSLFVFLTFGSFKNIAFDFRFLRTCDIENGALAIIAMLSILMRYVLVTPIWLCFIGGSALSRFPDRLTGLCWVYLFVKCIGFCILCFDFAGICEGFFKSVLLRAPAGARCERCQVETRAQLTTQCGHSFCLSCIDTRRQIEAACPICKASLPRKWSMPLKDGTISTWLLACVL
jgi:hypothetical protein